MLARGRRREGRAGEGGCGGGGAALPRLLLLLPLLLLMLAGGSAAGRVLVYTAPSAARAGGGRPASAASSRRRLQAFAVTDGLQRSATPQPLRIKAVVSDPTVQALPAATQSYLTQTLLPAAIAFIEGAVSTYYPTPAGASFVVPPVCSSVIGFVSSYSRNAYYAFPGCASYSATCGVRCWPRCLLAAGS